MAIWWAVFIRFILFSNIVCQALDFIEHSLLSYKDIKYLEMRHMTLKQSLQLKLKEKIKEVLIKLLTEKVLPQK